MSLPSMFSAAVLPWLNATSQCSIRIRAPPWMTDSYSQMSPAAYTPGTELSSREEQRTPPRSPISSPAFWASCTSGVTPAPTTTASAASSRPPLRDHLGDASIALEALELVAGVEGHAVRFEQLLEEASGARAEVAFERHLLLHHDRARLPIIVSDAATSQAMNEPPISTTCSASATPSRIASALPSVRR